MLEHGNGETEIQVKKPAACARRALQCLNSCLESVVILPAMPRIGLAELNFLTRDDLIATGEEILRDADLTDPAHDLNVFDELYQEGELTLTARNDWEVVLRATAEDDGEELTARVDPPCRREVLDNPEAHVRPEHNFLSSADLSATREEVRMKARE